MDAGIATEDNINWLKNEHYPYLVVSRKRHRDVEHDLLQAIARVNRNRDGKACGYVVDYIRIARALKAALTESDEGEEGGRPDTGIDAVRDEIPRLTDRHRKVLAVF